MLTLYHTCLRSSYPRNKAVETEKMLGGHASCSVPEPSPRCPQEESQS